MVLFYMIFYGLYFGSAFLAMPAAIAWYSFRLGRETEDPFWKSWSIAGLEPIIGTLLFAIPMIFGLFISSGLLASFNLWGLGYFLSAIPSLFLAIRFRRYNQPIAVREGKVASYVFSSRVIMMLISISLYLLLPSLVSISIVLAALSFALQFIFMIYQLMILQKAQQRNQVDTVVRQISWLEDETVHEWFDDEAELIKVLKESEALT